MCLIGLRRPQATESNSRFLWRSPLHAFILDSASSECGGETAPAFFGLYQ
jgi:hypothetical protein